MQRQGMVHAVRFSLPIATLLACSENAATPGDDSESSAGGSESSDSETDTSPVDTSTGELIVEIAGSVQKGPFVLGSSVDAAPLDDDGNPVGDVFPTSTIDDLGTFDLALPVLGPVALEADGFYFNEVTGTLSEAPLTLRAIYVVENAGLQSAYVNLVTHLTSARIEVLLAQGSTFPDAIAQAEAELREELGIGLPTFDPDAPGTTMNMLGGDEPANAYLLAVSAVLAQAGVDAAGGPDGSVDAFLQQLVNDIALDSSDDGALDPSLRAAIDAAELSLDPAAVMVGLAARLDDLGSTAVVPDIDQILDPDDDLLVNADDNCDRIANASQDNADDDAYGDACDNCPEDANDDQVDDDDDGTGDACDAMCGDAVVGPGEECDDGANGDQSDDCTDGCTAPVCGDAIVWANEDCDDGNDEDGDGCNAGCVGPAVVEWETTWGEAGNANVTDLALAAGGAPIVVGQDPAGFVRRHEADGTFAWESSTVDAPDAVAVDDADGIVVTTSQNDAASLRHFEPDGSSLGASALDGRVVYDLAVIDTDVIAFSGVMGLSAVWNGVFDATGVVEWEDVLDAPMNGSGYGFSVALAADDQIAFGYYLGPPSQATVEMSAPDGTVSWSHSYAAFTPPLVAVGPNGEVVACWSVYVPTEQSNVMARAWSSDGDEGWTWDYEGPNDSADGCTDVEIDSQGRAVLVINSALAANTASLTKLDADGELVWAWGYPQGGDPRHDGVSVEIDDDDHIVFAVNHDVEGDSDIWLGRLTP